MKLFALIALLSSTGTALHEPGEYQFFLIPKLFKRLYEDCVALYKVDRIDKNKECLLTECAFQNASFILSDGNNTVPNDDKFLPFYKPASDLCKSETIEDCYDYQSFLDCLKSESQLQIKAFRKICSEESRLQIGGRQLLLGAKKPLPANWEICSKFCLLQRMRVFNKSGGFEKDYLDAVKKDVAGIETVAENCVNISSQIGDICKRSYDIFECFYKHLI